APPREARRDGARRRRPRERPGGRGLDLRRLAARAPGLTSAGEGGPDPSEPARPAIARILDHLAAATGADFRDYRAAMVERRIAERVAATGSADLDAYRARLEREPAELARLIEALSIHVTSFFRDPGVFEAIRDRALPLLA